METVNKELQTVASEMEKELKKKRKRSESKRQYVKWMSYC